MQYGKLTFEEIKQCARQGWPVIIPTGCTEQQGPHLTVDFDTWLVEEVTLAASEHAAREYRVDSLVLPAVPFGPTPEHRGFGSGYIHLPQPVHELVVAAILDSLVEQGFRRIAIWRGCGQHDLTRVVEQFNATRTGQARVVQPALPYHEIWRQVGDASIPGGHADSFATSIALYKRPDAVRKEHIANPKSKPVAWDDPELDFSRYSKTGVIGDPTHASAELGAKLWQQMLQKVGQVIKELAEMPLV
jgi:creatinine amidohydrolase